MNKTLIVDDNLQNRYLLESILKGSGYRVISAKNGMEALELITKELPDIIISDILMPVMDGFELCRKCKEDERLKQIPFLFYTATYTEPKDEQFALSLGADKFIIKPQKPEILEKMIRETLEEYMRGDQTLPSKPLGEEAEFLRQYNEVLFSKLEKKVFQLENEVNSRKLAEKKITQLNSDLEHRVRDRTIQLENALQELESLSYSVSHDLKTPLRHINSFALLLKSDFEKVLNEKGEHYLDVIIESSVKMTNMIDDLLYYSSLGQKELIKQKINLNLLVENVIQDFEFEKKGRDIVFNLTPLPEVRADSSMLRIIYTNLISNAVKYTLNVEHAVITAGYGEDKENYILFIKDNGVGFEMSHAAKLFGVFQRLHNEKDYEGTGVGLAIVRQIVKRHGGKIWAESQSGKGAIFNFTIPKYEVQNG